MKRALGAALVLATVTGSVHATPVESRAFWDLKPDQLRVLVASPQVMVTRTASGYRAA